MTEDEREAENEKYGSRIGLVLRLVSGRYAVFNNARKCIGIVEDWNQVHEKLVECWTQAREHKPTILFSNNRFGIKL